MNTHKLFTQSWRTPKKFDFRDCRMPFRFPREQKTKIIIKTPTVPRDFLTMPDFEKSVVMEQFMEKLQFLIDKNEVIKGFRQQDYLQGLEQEGYNKELKDKLKVLNDNIKKYNLPKDQSEALRKELLKEFMLNSKATQKTSQLNPVNVNGDPLNQLGTIARQPTQEDATQITTDILHDVISDAVDLAEAQTGINLPLAQKTATATAIMDKLTDGTEEEQKWITIFKNSPSVKKLVRTEAENMKLALLYGRWMSLRTVFRADIGRKRLESEDEVSNKFSDKRLTEMWQILQSQETGDLDRIFKPLAGSTEIIKQRNKVIEDLRQTIDEGYSLGRGGGDEPIRTLQFGDE